MSKPEASAKTRVFRGLGASRGIAIGRAYPVEHRRLKVPKQKIAAVNVPNEIDRFKRALADSHQQLENLKTNVPESIEEPGDILAAHQTMLNDELLVQGTVRRITDEEINAEYALMKTVGHIKEVFEHIDDDYFRERRSDVEFVGERILRNLTGEGDLVVTPPADAVAISRVLSPADAVQLHKAAVTGLATEAGGLTSHTALIARAFELPAVVGVEGLTSRVTPNDLIVLDGQAGIVILNPAPETVSEYREKSRKLAVLEQEMLQDRDLPAETTDGVRLMLAANIELPEEVPSALQHGAESVGLYRTEYLYLGRANLPGEEELISAFKKVLHLMGDRAVTFRSFDLGGDKATHFFQMHPEANPALGLRSTRLALKQKDAFKTHLRALLRSVEGNKLRIMFPMISDVSELRAAKEVLYESKEELENEGYVVPRELTVGIMVEMPSAAVISDMLAEECDFFSIGSNDLIQYTLAIDRVNEHVVHLYHPLHPAILRLIKQTVESAHRAGLRVSLCGAMAGEPMLTVVLVGLGIDELSMPPLALPLVKQMIRRSTFAGARELVKHLLKLDTVDAIESHVLRYMETHYKDVIDKTKQFDLFAWRTPPQSPMS
jgi:phosphotransferase system enzyme I (PtsI)